MWCFSICNHVPLHFITLLIDLYFQLMPSLYPLLLRNTCTFALCIMQESEIQECDNNIQAALEQVPCKASVYLYTIHVGRVMHYLIAVNLHLVLMYTRMHVPHTRMHACTCHTHTHTLLKTCIHVHVCCTCNLIYESCCGYNACTCMGRTYVELGS